MSRDEHYFSSDPAGQLEEREIEVRLRGHDVTVLTAGGVFSADRLDPGTRVLLSQAPPPPRDGDLLDLGCGWGPLSLALAMASPTARVWAVDVNPRAVDLTRRNAQRLGLDGVTACAPDDVPDDVQFAAIWSNPPIRIGKPALHELLAAWLPRLEEDGSAYMVVQRHLGADSLHDWLARAFDIGWDVARYASAKGYRVLRVRCERSAL